MIYDSIIDWLHCMSITLTMRHIAHHGPQLYKIYNAKLYKKIQGKNKATKIS